MREFIRAFCKRIGIDRHGPVANLYREYRVRRRTAKARLGRARFTGKVIGITGSSGKSTTTQLLAHILASQGSVFAPVYKNVLNLLVRSLDSMPPDNDFAVFEVGASHLSSVAPQADLIRPDVAVVTMVRDEHRSTYGGPDGVAKAKRPLVDVLPPGGWPSSTPMTSGCWPWRSPIAAAW